jgi:hypothetical protein
MRHRLAAHDKGALGPGAPDLIGQVIERLHPDVQPPGKTHGAKRLRFATVQGDHSLK